MASLGAPPDLSFEGYTIHYAVDEYLSTVLIFHGPVSTGASSSSRIQTTIFTSAGWQHYPRITLAPTSPLYAAVNHLPREKQGDEVCRGQAVSLLKYFAELSDVAKDALAKEAQRINGSTQLPRMFDEMHAANIANRMEKVDNPAEIIKDLQTAFAERVVSSVDVDFMLPSTCFGPRKESTSSRGSSQCEELLETRFGQYAEVIQQLGEPIFIPTPKIRRAPSKAASTSKTTEFATDKKEALRLSMCEIVDTEERYVSKLYDLVHSVIQDCRQKARTKAAISTSPDEDALDKIFPPCLDDILKVNLGFLNAIRASLEDTEGEAMEDIAKGAETTSNPKRHDPLGAVRFGRVMLEWFPQFSEPYKQYLKVQPGFSSTLSFFMREPNSTFTRRVQETGEQRLRSLLMEPVQRLPRYSLLIDAMTSTIPASHPAVRPLLKARDIVTEICALDTPEKDNKLQTHSKIREQVGGWPALPVSQGRLITAVDLVSIKPPFRMDMQSSFTQSHMLLLFSDTLVLLDKTAECHTSSRGFLANLDKPAGFDLSRSSPTATPQADLEYSWAVPVQKLALSHSRCGRVLHLDLLNPSSTSDAISGAFRLVGVDEGKAARFCEDISKAHAENRFTEEERGSERWSLHSTSIPLPFVQLFAALCEEESTTQGERRGIADFRVYFGRNKAERQQLLSKSSSTAVISVSKTANRYRIEIDHIFGTGSIDITTIDDLMSVLSRRISLILTTRYSTANPALASTIVNLGSKVLSSISPKSSYATKSHKGFRPPSPTKLLASLWGGGSVKGTTKLVGQTPTLGDIPNFNPSTTSLAAPPTSGPHLERSDSIVKLIASEQRTIESSVQLLEKTLTAYILSLRSRAGNILGRTLRSRDTADEVAVNDLYNVLLEDPSKIQAAAEVSNDVLFVAFEKFMSHAWKDQIADLVSPETLKKVQHQFDRLFPGDFETFFKNVLSDLSPQNRRALTAIVKLLADLLDASGNDGDRGALTVAFAELISRNDDPLKHISLLDRMVEDYEKLFDDNTAIGFSSLSVPESQSQGNNNSLAAKTGSVNSQTSSFRKRFGFGLNRENSKHEPESKVSSIIRSLSKTKTSEPNPQSSSLSKGSLVRSRSTDTDSRIVSLLRPVSRDRPLTNTLSSEDYAHASRPGSAHSTAQVLESIGELPPKTEKALSKKKRRSSLSDLKSLNRTSSIPLSPAQLRKPLEIMKSPPASSVIAPVMDPIVKSAPIVTTPPVERAVPIEKTIPPEKLKATSPARTGSTRLGSPIRSSPRKENITSPTMSKVASPVGTMLPRRTGISPSKGYLAERAVNRKSDEVVVKSQTPKKRSDAVTGIPTPRAGPRERPHTAGGKIESPTRRPLEQPSPQKVQKLRMQSPQKLRERLNKEKQTIAAAESSFQAELTKIGDELSQPTSSGSGLQSRVTTLETKLHSLTTELSTRLSSVQKDLETSLTVSDRRTKKVDDLFRESTAENEALYDRFNKELARTLRNVRAGPSEGVEELKKKLDETAGELQKVKKENWRLKREVAVLKAQSEGAAMVAGEKVGE